MFCSLYQVGLNISGTRSVQNALTYGTVMFLHATMLKKYEKYRQIC